MYFQILAFTKLLMQLQGNETDHRFLLGISLMTMRLTVLLRSWGQMYSKQTNLYQHLYSLCLCDHKCFVNSSSSSSVQWTLTDLETLWFQIWFTLWNKGVHQGSLLGLLFLTCIKVYYIFRLHGTALYTSTLTAEIGINYFQTYVWTSSTNLTMTSNLYWKTFSTQSAVITNTCLYNIIFSYQPCWKKEVKITFPLIQSFKSFPLTESTTFLLESRRFLLAVIFGSKLCRGILPMVDKRLWNADIKDGGHSSVWTWKCLKF